MANIYEKAMTLDRRIIYLVIGIVVLVPLLFPLNLPTQYTKPVLNVYNYLERISSEKTNPVILMSFNYTGSTLPELQPMARAIIRHCYMRDIKVMGYCFASPVGEAIAERLLVSLSEEYNTQRGKDFVNFGYRRPATPILLGMGTNIYEVFPQDNRGTPVDSIPMMKNVKTYSDVDLVIELTGSGSYRSWIIYARGKYGQDIAAGITGVMAAECYPFLQSEQLKGLLPGLKGAAEYEKLVDNLEEKIGKKGDFKWEQRKIENLKRAIRENNPKASPEKIEQLFKERWEQSKADNRKARVGMDSQAIAHIAIIFFVIIGNIGYMLSERKSKL